MKLNGTENSVKIIWSFFILFPFFCLSVCLSLHTQIGYDFKNTSELNFLFVACYVTLYVTLAVGWLVCRLVCQSVCLSVPSLLFTELIEWLIVTGSNSIFSVLFVSVLHVPSVLVFFSLFSVFSIDFLMLFLLVFYPP